MRRLGTSCHKEQARPDKKHIYTSQMAQSKAPTGVKGGCKQKVALLEQLCFKMATLAAAAHSAATS